MNEKVKTSYTWHNVFEKSEALQLNFRQQKNDNVVHSSKFFLSGLEEMNGFRKCVETA